jgi:mannosyltransferase OCH1-like enzyme
MAIPKIIHYCWFGGNPIPENQAKYIEGWKKILPDYEFKLWNEENFDISSVKFTQQVASARKWGFIVDYVRAYAVYNFGGIYLDTDIEVIKRFDDLLDTNCFAGFENETCIAPGLIFAGEKGCEIALEIMNFYKDYDFIKSDGSLNLTTSPRIFSQILLKYGFQANNSYQKLKTITIYPIEFFSPKSFKTGIVTITKNTYSIHHFEGSWLSEKGHKEIKERWDFYAKYGDHKYVSVMYKIYRKIKRIMKKL